MKPGRKPTPTKLRILRGNPGKRAIPESIEPPTPPALPEPPDFIGAKGRAEWYRTGEALHRLGMLTEIDLPALTAYAVAWDRWIEAEAMIRKTGPIVKAPNTGVAMQNPYLSIANKAMSQIRGFLSDFGMSPTARASIPAPPPAATKDDLGSFIARARALKKS